MELAITGDAKDIYPRLTTVSMSRFEEDHSIERLCGGIHVTDDSQIHYTPRSDDLPLTWDDLRFFLDEELQSFKRGYWVVPWFAASKRQGGIVYEGRFRGVVTFRTMEFMVRPLRPFKRDGTDPGWLR